MTDTVAPQPVGPVVDSTPAVRPGPATFEGRFCRVEKLDPARHSEGLWQALKGDDRVWAYLANGPYADPTAFANWLDERAVMLDPYTYVIVDKASARPLGVVTLMEIRPAARVVEIGNIIYSPTLQRTPAATETQYLMARYVFDDLGYRRYEWKCNALNAPSMRAAERFGFTYEGIFRQHMIVKGRNRDTAWFSITDGEWPGVKTAYETWLAPGNFDASGKQRMSLTDLMKKRETK
jgi:RimJ/RimL family protein N-acetyltransferase